MRTQVGSVAALWRYPVKSMLGEKLEALQVVSHGILGDRAYALWDVESDRVASAKNPKKWATLLECHAAFIEAPGFCEPMPPVEVSLPSGKTVTSEMSEVSMVLSQALGRSVQLLSSAPEQASLDQYWPNVEGTAHQEAITQLFMPAGTFFDSCSVHAITTATLARLQQLYPEGTFEPCRFRPNILIEPISDEVAFVEDAWVDRVLAIGEEVRLSIDTACPRCVVTTLAQSGLPDDLKILRTTAQHNNVIAGIRASVLQGGVIQCNDPIWLE